MFGRGIGNFGEQQACVFLQRNFFVIIERNFYTNFGEIDIIAYDNNLKQLVFIEVKTRLDDNSPEYAITSKKYYKMEKSAWYFMRSKKMVTENYRFDSIAVIIFKKIKKAKIRHIKGIYF